MFKGLNDCAKALFADALQARLPAYQLKKRLRGPVSGVTCHEMRVDASRAAWVAFGGFKDADFVLLCAWTSTGQELKQLEEWEQYGNPRAFEVPPVPTDGYVDLRDRWRFENPAQGGAWHPLTLGSPPQELVASIYASTIASPQFAQEIQQAWIGAQRLNTRNPPALDQVRADCLRTEQAYCRSSWAHLSSRYAFSPAETQALVTPVVNQAVELVQKYGHPLITHQLGL